MTPNFPQHKTGVRQARVRFHAAYRLLEEAIEAKAFPGCAFGVLAGNEIVLLDALGRFTYDPASPAVGPMTMFDVASLTKVVATTAMTMVLWQSGGLDLEQPVSDLLPDFATGRAADDPAKLIRLRHLLAHNSGLPGYVEFFKTTQSAVELSRMCLNLQVSAFPEERAEYSDPGFILLGKALEKASGKGLYAFVHREVFGPLGMSATQFLPPAHKRDMIPPTEHDAQFRNKVLQGEVQDENAWVLGGIAGHAGLFSNVGDLLSFSQGILTAGDTGSPFSAKAIETFATRQDPVGSSRALGWDTPSENSSAGDLFSERSIGHLGYSGCSLWIDRSARIAVVLLTNRTWPDRKSQAIKQVRPAFHNAVRQVLR